MTTRLGGGLEVSQHSRPEADGRPARRTATSAFGTAGREGHDASRFYASRMYEDTGGDRQVADCVAQALPAGCRGRIFCKSSESMTELPDGSVQLMITSPPYNAAKEYDQDLSLDEYQGLLNRVWGEVWRVLAPGGRACVNVANLGRKPYIPLHALVMEGMLAAGFMMRGEIIWNKGSSAGASTAWGSWLSAANPVLRDVHEYILIFSKDALSRPGAGRTSTIEKDEFLAWTKSVWAFPTCSARKIGHPAPFPEELPQRLIQLYSFVGDVVLDPFAGSGTVSLVAARAGREHVAYESCREYVKLAQRRLAGAGFELPEGQTA